MNLRIEEIKKAKKYVKNRSTLALVDGFGKSSPLAILSAVFFSQFHTTFILWCLPTMEKWFSSSLIKNKFKFSDKLMLHFAAIFISS